MRENIRHITILAVVLLLVSGGACSQKRKPLVPLGLENEVKAQATALTEEGTQAYQAKQYEEAKRYFEQAMAAAPQSGPAHYNYALALNALGDSEVARQHFLEAANLSPGDKTIWDSPALAAYGNPENKGRTKDRPYGTHRPNFGGMPRY